MKVQYNAEQRRLTYQTLREILERLKRDDAAVASRDVRPDGYSRGGDGGRRNGHGDPTYSVVVQILGGEATGSLVEQYFGKIHQIAKLAEEVDSLRAGLIPPSPVERAEDYCESCYRVLLSDHRGRERHLCNPIYRGKYCWFCTDWRRDHKGQLPPVKLLERRQEVGKVTSQMVREFEA